MSKIIKLSTPVFLITLFGLISMQFMQSCRRHYEYNSVAVNPFDNATMVNATVYGQVIDEAGQPVVGATVKTGNYVNLTDANGVFFFKNINTAKKATCVVVSKVGYFNGSRTLVVNAGQMHQVLIRLMDRGVPKTFVASNGGSVQFDGIGITFAPYSVVNKATGVAYTGQVYVYAKKLDPTVSTTRETMPGDLRGLTSGDQEEKLLQSFGMMTAELTDVNGNALQIKEGEQAILKFDIPASLSSSAPSTIALWYFDETTGMWLQEGSAKLINGKYEGTVQHFSFWNCDTPEAAIYIEMNLVDQNNNPLQGYMVKLTNQSNNDSRYGTTNNSGWVGGLAYSNATLTLEVFSNVNLCSSSASLYTQNIVTSSINLNAGTITVNIPTALGSSFDGTIIDCNNLPTSNGVVYVSPLGLMITPNSNGVFSYSLPCTPTQALTFTAYDLTNNVNGSLTATLAAGSNTLGNIYACGNVTPYLDLVLTNTVTSVTDSLHFSAPTNYLAATLYDSAPNPAYTVIYASASSNQLLSFQSTDTVAGTAPITMVSCFPGTAVFTDTQYTLQPGGTVTYTSFPMYPGHVLGTYTMTLVGVPSGHTYTATGTFRVPRTN